MTAKRKPRGRPFGRGLRDRCAKLCGNIDSNVKNSPRQNHLCILAPDHPGLCDFIRPCRLSLD